MDRNHHGLVPGLAAPELAHADPAGLAPLGAVAAAPAGLSPPRKDEAHRLAGAAGLKGQDKADTKIFADIDAGRKSFVLLQARYAMAGFALLELADGTLLAARWNCCKPLADLYAATRFLRQIGGKP